MTGFIYVLQLLKYEVAVRNFTRVLRDLPLRFQHFIVVVVLYILYLFHVLIGETGNVLFWQW